MYVSGITANKRSETIDINNDENEKERVPRRNTTYLDIDDC